MRVQRLRLKVESEFSQEFYVVVGVNQESVLSLSLFAIMVDVVTENAREGLIKKLLYADDLVLMSETMESLKEKFLKWRSALESKGLKENLEKMKVKMCVRE